MPDILITEFMAEGAVEDLAASFDTRYDPTLVEDPNQLGSLIQDSRALIVRNRTQVNMDLLEHAHRLECVGRLGVGLDNIDQEACAARGVAVYPATGANDQSVAEYVITMVLVLLRGAYLATDRVRNGSWPRQNLIGRETAGRTLGLIGLGNIARQVASRAKALGMDVTAFDPLLPDADPIWEGVQRKSLADLLKSADAISLHVPLTAETRGLIGADEFAAMPRGSVVINTARGGVLDEAALAEALRMRHIGGAALDVFAAEPLDADAGAAFDGLDNVILTPHVAGVTEESNLRVSALIARRITAHLGGV